MQLIDFKNRYPSLSSSHADEHIASSIEFARILATRNGLTGELLDEGVGLLTAHLLVVDDKSRGGGAVLNATSKKVGDVAYSYSVGSNDERWYMLSGYGQKFLMLLSLLPRYGGAFVV